LTLALVALVLANDVAVKDAFLHFQRRFKRSYATQEEFNMRFQIFQENMVEAERLQALNPKARFGVTKFSDLSKAEFKKQYLMNVDFANYVAPPVVNHATQKISHSVKPNPTTYDWNSAGVITAVKNQGQCGSCWAFSATETIESQWKLCGHSIPTLAPEQIVDCDTAGQDQGCNGGFPSGAYQYVEQAGGLDSEASYPYTAGESGSGGSCNFQAGSVQAKVSNYNSVNGETGLYQQLSTAGPASICVDASSWQNYNGGVLTTCGNNVDHCVQLTGYNGYNSQNAYWNVRNSWGADWGENGYIWIQIGQDLCSLGDYATIVSC